MASEQTQLAPVDDDALVEKHYRVSEIARLLSVDRRTVNRLIESRTLEAVDLNPSSTGRPWWRVPHSSLDEYMQLCRDRPRRRKVKSKSPAIKPAKASSPARPAKPKTVKPGQKPKRQYV